MMQRRSTARGPRFIRNSWLLILILVLLGTAIWILSPSGTNVLHRQQGNLGLRLGLDLKGGVQVVYTGVFSENTTDAQKSFDIDAAISSIRQRIDKYGVVEPVIQKQGNDRILIQLPGIGDVDEARRLVEQTAFLEFREVEMKGTSPATLGDYLSENRTGFFETGDIGAEGAPINREFVDSSGQPVVFIQESGSGLKYVDVDGNAIDPTAIDTGMKTALSWMPAVGEVTRGGVTTKVVLTGAYLSDASPQAPSQSSVNAKISVGITWNSEGTDLFNEVAQRIKNKGSLNTSQRALGIFLDDERLAAPEVFPSDMTASSYGSSASISGDYTWKEARTLAIQLTSGALPISLKELFSSNVSATLGADFVHKAFVAGLIGLLVVVLFMIAIYRLPGAIASVALVIYAILVLAIYKLIPVTMSLAGVAGFVVSLGMAVDANVLIFERLKEELRAGRTLKAAMDAGFSRAWLAIRDSNISTFIACGILYWFGSSIVASPAVKGFALTLFIGVAVSMFSAIVSTRTFLLSFTGPWATERLTWFGVEAKSEVEALPRKQGEVDFVGKRYWFFLLSALVIVPGMISLAVFGLKPGVDFRSGTSITISLSTEVAEGQLRDEVASLGYSDAIVQRTGDTYLIRIPGEPTTKDKQNIVDGIQTRFETEVTVEDFSAVSPIVAAQTARNAAIAIAVASVGILLYITFAFRRMPSPFRWGICAIIALLHDIMVVVGIFSIMGWLTGAKVDVMFITGMLTVTGYSVHDTIVVFDRIRENMSKHIGKDFEETVNVSIVQTLTRSLNTSITVFLVLLTLLLLVGGTIHNFTIVLLIGVVTGTYSSVCNASQLLIVWENGEWRRLFSWLPFLRRPNPQT